MAALPPLSPETIFHVSGFPVTNTMINTWLALGVFIITGLAMRFIWIKNVTARGAPKGALNIIEGITVFILNYMDQVTGNRLKSLKLLPIVGSFFLFILTANWMGLLPGTGSIGIWEMHEGHRMLLPLFRPANTDLNMTLAMAVLAVASSHILGVTAIGFFKYAGRFIKIYPIYKALIRLQPTEILVAVVEFFVGFIEIFSEVAKMVSLSLRLYGNIFAGEVLLTIIASLVAYFVPLPFMALEIIVGLVQATVFSMLTLVYLHMATTESTHEAEHG